MADHLLHLRKTRYNLAAVYAAVTAAEWILWWQLGLGDGVRAHPFWSVFVAILSALAVVALVGLGESYWVVDMSHWSLGFAAWSAAFQSAVWSYVHLGGWWSIGFCVAVASFVILLHTLLWRYGLAKSWLFDQLVLRESQPVLDILSTKYKVFRSSIVANAIARLSSRSRDLSDAAIKILEHVPDQAAVDPLVRTLDDLDAFECHRRLGTIKDILRKTGTVLSEESFERAEKVFLNTPYTSHRKDDLLEDLVAVGDSKHSARLISLMNELLDYGRGQDAAVSDYRASEIRSTAARYLVASRHPESLERARRKVTLPLLQELTQVIQSTLQQLAQGHEFTYERWTNEDGYSGESGEWVNVLSSVRTLTRHLGRIGDKGIIESVERLRRTIPSTLASKRSDTLFPRKAESTQNEMLVPIDDLINTLHENG